MNWSITSKGCIIPINGCIILIPIKRNHHPFLKNESSLSKTNFLFLKGSIIPIKFSSLLVQKKLWKLWGHIAALSMGLISGTWEGTRRSRYTLPGAHPSSWHGAAHNRPGHISCSRLCPVASLARFVKFFHGLRSSASHDVQVMSRFVARDG